MKNILATIPKELKEPKKAVRENGCFFYNKNETNKSFLGGIKLKNLKRFLSLGRFDPQGRFDAKNEHPENLLFEPHWVAPSYGKTEQEILKETQFLLWERTDNKYGILLPLIDKDLRVSLSGNDSGVQLDFDGVVSGIIPEHSKLAFALIGDNPLEVIKEAFSIVRKCLDTFTLREEKKNPQFSEYLGWCTWDAFYTEVDEESVLDGLQSFKNGGILPKFLILDDGWLDADNNQLKNFPALEKSFPDGLKKLITKTKEEYGIELFAVWHAFVGYWWGLHPDGELSKKYSTIKNTAYTPFGGWKQEDPLYLIDPNEIADFYEEFYSWLAEQGVDMVKVDGQSGLEWFTKNKLGRGSTMKAYQEALQNASQKHFNGNILHCMSQGNDVAYNMKQSNSWRNSMDYYPKADREVQQAHVHQNAMNNLWSSNFCQPDWDMFQTHAKNADFHAMARAISGGSIYVSDHPHKQDFEMLKKFCLENGKVLTCDEPAMPAKESIFVDCWNEPEALKVINKSKDTKIIGLFNCNKNEEKPLIAKYSPSDIFEEEAEYVIWNYNDKTISLSSLKDEFEIELAPAKANLIFITEVNKGFASIGIVDKYISPATIEKIEQNENKAIIYPICKGEYLAWLEKSPIDVLQNGKSIDYIYDIDLRKLSVNIEDTTSLEVIIK